jgi:PAS domain S-box-containing protein
MVNKAYAEFWGLFVEQIAHQKISDVLPTQLAEDAIKDNRLVFSQRSTRHSERWITNYEGESRYVTITKTPKLDGYGNVDFVVCCAGDITARKRFEDDLLQNQSQIKAIFSCLPFAIAIVNCSDDRIKWANQQLFDLFDKASTEELIGQKCEDALPSKQVDVPMEHDAPRIEYIQKSNGMHVPVVRKQQEAFINGERVNLEFFVEPGVSVLKPTFNPTVLEKLLETNDNEPSRAI